MKGGKQQAVDLGLRVADPLKQAKFVIMRQTKFQWKKNGS